DEELITREEYAERRDANIGALLPYTQDPPAAGLSRSVPSTDAIVARLAALKRAFEMRAITAQQHALERTMILNALLPQRPDPRSEPEPPPRDVIAGAAKVGHLEVFRRQGLISGPELEAEKAAIEQILRSGTFPQTASLANSRDSGALLSGETSASQLQGPSNSGSPSNETADRPITGPVLHIASFRSRESAQRGWNEVLERNSEVLASLEPIIRRVDLGPGQGIFYRLMAGTFESAAAAEAVCIELKKNNQFCRTSPDGT
ncbi:MAG: SPOR domain-containing protein, partial [Rhodospirillaceae bacterium]